MRYSDKMSGLTITEASPRVIIGRLPVNYTSDAINTNGECMNVLLK